MKEKPDWLLRLIGIVFLCALAAPFVWAATDSQTTVTQSSTVNGYQNANLGNPDEYIRPHNRSVNAPEFDRVAYPTNNAGTPVGIVTPIPANTPGTASGCLFQNPASNPVVCVGIAPLVGTPGTTQQCQGGIELKPGESTYQPAPNGDCGKYLVNVPAVGTNSYSIKLEIDPQ